MNIFEGLEKYRRNAILDRLLPDGIDFQLALKICQVLCYDLCLINVEFAKEADETSFEIIRRLHYNIYELTEDEKHVLGDYCYDFVLREYARINNN